MKTTFLKSLTGVTATMMLASLAGAQVANNEVEPNDNKASATLANSGGPGMVAGDYITGVSTGTSTTAGGVGANADTFRVKMAPAALAIYRHELTIAGTPWVMTIRGLSQTGTAAAGGTIGTGDNTLVTAAAVSGNEVASWYGFGKQEELYVRVTGAATTTAAYTATLSTTAVTPIDITGTIVDGSITIRPPASNTSDLDWWLYDANLDPIPGAGRDSGTPLGHLTTNLAPGTYYVAWARFNAANNQASGPGESFFGTVLDFPGAFSSSASTTTTPQGIEIVSSAGTVTGTAPAVTKVGEVMWYKFTVVPNTVPTPPQGVGSRSPAAVDLGGTVQLNVQVTPGQNPASTGITVVADASAMGGPAALSLLDDGLNGDGAAGDNNFGASVVTSVSGTHTLPFVVADAESRSTGGNFPSTIVRSAPPACPPGQEAQTFTGLNSTGLAGNAGNSVQTFSFTSSDPVLALHLSGRCVAQTSATYRSEARWRITPPGGTPILVQPNTVTGGGWDHFDVLDHVVTIPGSPAANAGVWTIETYESFDDAGLDATWRLCIAMEPNTAPTPPTINGQAANGVAGQSVLLRAVVTGGINPPSTGITVSGDLSSVGGSATQTFYDDGSNGDAVPGDGTFSYLYSVPGATAIGVYNLPMTATDAESRTGNGTIALTIDDAGNLPANARNIDGVGPISSITGSLGSADVDMFRIFICDPANFSASCVAGTTVSDTQLFLFDSTGLPVVANDDEGVTNGTLRSTITSELVAAQPAGVYYLAITSYDNDPRDAANVALFPDSIAAGCFGSIYRCQMAPSNPSVINNWDGGGTNTGTYTIALSGVNGEPCPTCAGNECGTQDFNGDGDFGTDQDIEAFFACLAGTCCETCFCQGQDFNGDGDFGTDQDIEAFFRVLAGSTSC